MPKLQANGIELFCETQEAGEPLLLIAGFACDRTIWGKVTPRLASKFQVITFDNRGMGQSSALDSPCSIRQLAEDAAGLLNALAIDRVHVAGHSMGGQIAQELALAHPGRVRSLSLLSSCAKLDERGRALIEMFGELPGLVDAQTCARIIMPWLYTNAFYATPWAVEQLVKLLLENPYPPTPQAMFHQSRAIAAFDATGRLGSIRWPTLVLIGQEDILLPPSFSQQLAEAISNAELVVLEKTGHGLLIETPEAVATTMLDFLARL